MNTISHTRAGKSIATAALCLALVAGGGTTASAAQSAATLPAAAHATNLGALPGDGSVATERGGPGRATVGASCSNGRCTVYFSRAETAALARGSVPTPPAFMPLPLKAAYYGAAYAHRWFAAQYAKRGWCSGFRLSIYPWESQGYFGYAC